MQAGIFSLNLYSLVTSQVERKYTHRAVLGTQVKTQAKTRRKFNIYIKTSFLDSVNSRRTGQNPRRPQGGGRIIDLQRLSTIPIFRSLQLHRRLIREGSIKPWKYLDEEHVQDYLAKKVAAGLVESF